MKKLIVLVVSLLLLTGCAKEDTNRVVENNVEKSTRIPNSVVGTWYQVENWDYVDVWAFTSDGKFDHFDEEENLDEGDYYFTYKIENNKENDIVTIIDKDGEVFNKYKVEYTEEGLKLLYVTEAGRPHILYESRQEALESCEDYYNTPSYYKTIADEEGFVIEDGVLIRYVGDAEEITIPSNVEKMAKLSMWGEKTKKVTIPGNVKVIESAAFLDERIFQYIYIEEGVEEIGAGAFPDLLEIHFPESVKKMGTDVFDTYEGSVSEYMKIYVKKGSYAHKYFIEAGLEEHLVFEE